MRLKITWMVTVLLAGVVVARADVVLDFLYSGVNLGGLQPITLAFDIDVAGNVTLDASTASAEAVNIAAVDAWDGSVGTVSAGFNTSFTLITQTETKGITLRQTATGAAGEDIGALAVTGQNSGRIDASGAENLTFNASVLAAGLSLDIKSMDYGNRAATGGSNVYMEDSNGTIFTTLIPNTATYGALDVSAEGFSIAQGHGITFSTDPAKEVSAGYALGGFTFDVIPEPATVSLMALCGAVILIKRRIS